MSSRRIWLLKLILLLFWVDGGPIYPKMSGPNFPRWSEGPLYRKGLPPRGSKNRKIWPPTFFDRFVPNQPKTAIKSILASKSYGYGSFLMTCHTTLVSEVRGCLSAADGDSGIPLPTDVDRRCPVVRGPDSRRAWLPVRRR